MLNLHHFSKISTVTTCSPHHICYIHNNSCVKNGCHSKYFHFCSPHTKRLHLCAVQYLDMSEIHKERVALFMYFWTYATWKKYIWNYLIFIYQRDIKLFLFCDQLIWSYNHWNNQHDWAVVTSTTVNTIKTDRAWKQPFDRAYSKV